ncbi:MAG: succinate dehydrogenase assembly factor 2 [Dokdonella sp.]
MESVLNDAATIGRLRWRCRRGTRELDRLLQQWLDDHADRADARTLADFSVLLDAQDPDLWDWLIGKHDPDDPRLLELVREIRADHRL